MLNFIKKSQMSNGSKLYFSLDRQHYFSLTNAESSAKIIREKELDVRQISQASKL